MPYTIITSSATNPLDPLEIIGTNHTHTFTYDGLKWDGIIPAGAQSMEIYLWGGGGGGGAQETTGSNGYGAAGQYVTHSSIDLTTHIGESITIGVGGGGGGGSNGGGVAGGTNGRSLSGFSGGVGGASGPNGSSGSGGGGGGATVIKIGSTVVAVAGGGAGGAGGGADSQGGSGINLNVSTTGTPSTLGENGQYHNGNGGGGGAGGGGAAGGVGGGSNDNDTGGSAGYSGTSLIPAGGTSLIGSGTTPAGSYGSAAVGGNQANSGANGKAIIIVLMRSEAKVKIDGVWKSITQIKFKRDGIWKNITAAYTKINGVWKAIFNSGLELVSTSAGFGDATGNPATGSIGSGPAAASGGGGGGCCIICTKLYELGYLSEDIYKADEKFGHWLRANDPDAYYGYLKWARVVVDWMSSEGPQCMFWIKDKKLRGERQKAMATRWAVRIATPWAQHMAYKMGVLKEDSRAGRWIMNIGLCVSKLIGKCIKHTDKPTKNLTLGYAMWGIFSILYLIAGVK